MTRVGDLTFPVLRDRVDEVVEFDDAAIVHAMYALLERKKVLAEGAGAAPLAALLSGKVRTARGERIVAVISGGNVESAQLFRVIRQSLSRQGRIMHFSVILYDQPGTLARLLSVIAQERGNILHIHHTLAESNIPVLMAKVTIELETRGRDHIESIKKALLDNKYEITLG